MSDKYIVKNCPSFCKDICSADDTECFCCNETNCVMKQIVELCRHYKKHSDCGKDCPSFGSFLNKLLNKLDIQEVK